MLGSSTLVSVFSALPAEHLAPTAKHLAMLLKAHVSRPAHVSRKVKHRTLFFLSFSVFAI